MKRTVLLIAAVICLTGLLAISCEGLGLIVGAGPIETKNFDNQGFTGIEISGFIEYDISQSDNYSVSVSANQNIFDYLNIHQTGDTLAIGLKSGSYTNANIKVAVTMPELEKLQVSGASKGSAKGFQSTRPLDISVSGASQLETGIEAGSTKLEVTGASKTSGTLKVQGLQMTISGASRAELNGSAGTTSINISGASRLDAPDFQMQNTSINLSGASSASIFTQGDLSIEASGASSLSYAGNPNIKKLDVSGASKVNER